MVRQVQRKLQKWGYLKGAADGVFGQDTYEAVVHFQRKNGLTADGVVGDATFAALGHQHGLVQRRLDEHRPQQEPGPACAPGPTRRRAGSRILARWPSRRWCSTAWSTPSFPNTISGVIYQSGAFDVVADGQINMEPDAQAVRAAQDAMNGWDPTGGCIYYYNPARTTSSWIYSRTVMTVIGKHYFAI